MRRTTANSAKQAAKRRSGYKADADRGTEEPHILGPVFRA